MYNFIVNNLHWCVQALNEYYYHSSWPPMKSSNIIHTGMCKIVRIKQYLTNDDARRSTLIKYCRLNNIRLTKVLGNQHFCLDFDILSFLPYHRFFRLKYLFVSSAKMIFVFMNRCHVVGDVSDTKPMTNNNNAKFVKIVSVSMYIWKKSSQQKNDKYLIIRFCLVFPIIDLYYNAIRTILFQTRSISLAHAYYNSSFYDEKLLC